MMHVFVFMIDRLKRSLLKFKTS